MARISDGTSGAPKTVADDSHKNKTGQLIHENRRIIEKPLAIKMVIWIGKSLWNPGIGVQKIVSVRRIPRFSINEITCSRSEVRLRLPRLDRKYSPLYNTVLARTDFRLFPTLRKHHKRVRFQNGH